MKRSNRAALLVACVLTACSEDATTVGVSGAAIGPAGHMGNARSAEVAIVETGPAVSDGGHHVVAVSCKNKIGEPPPSREIALVRLKRQARELGYDAIHAVRTSANTQGIAKDCWMAITAEGIAFRQAAPAQ